MNNKSWIVDVLIDLGTTEINLFVRLEFFHIFW